MARTTLRRPKVAKAGRQLADTAFLALLIFMKGTAAQASSCSLCAAAPDQKLTAEQREIAFGIEGLPIETCGALEDLIPALPGDFCREAQRVSTFCGCPAPVANPCNICHDGSKMKSPEAFLPDVDISLYLSLAPEGVETKCSTFKHVLETYEADSSECAQTQATSTPCGCPVPSDDIFDDVEDDEEEQQKEEDKVKEEPCTLCTNRQAVTTPDRVLSLGPNFPASTCAELSAFAALIGSKNSQQCHFVQSIGTLCGCPASKEHACSLCPNGEKVPKPQQLTSIVERHGYIGDELVHNIFDGGDMTCEVFEAALLNPPPYFGGHLTGEFMCKASQFRSAICGCSASSEQKWSNWSFRISGTLSLMGSLTVLYQVLRSKKNRESTYHGLMGGISLYDCISSFAYILGPTMVQKEEGFFESAGNDATCRLQGFMLQLGMTALLFNTTLSIYFYMVIARNWREFHFAALRRYSFIVYSLVGIALACVGIPFYEPQWNYCYITRPGIQASGWIAPLFLFILPVCLMLLTVTVMVALLYWKVRQQQKRASKWSMKNSRVDISQKVFWSSFLYLLAVYIAWPFVLSTQVYLGEKTEHSWWWVLFGFVGPSQGIFNSLIYFYWTRSNTITIAAPRRRLSSLLERTASWRNTASMQLGKMLAKSPSSRSLNSKSINNKTGHTAASGSSHLHVNDWMEADPSFAEHNSEFNSVDEGLGIDEMGQLMGLVEIEEVNPEERPVEDNMNNFNVEAQIPPVDEESIEPRTPPASSRSVSEQALESETEELAIRNGVVEKEDKGEEEEAPESFVHEFAAE